MSHILTFTRQVFDFHNPSMRTYNIEDIAHALSNLCRYNGHTSEFYSVAQHSVMVAMQLPKHLQMAGLLHDASEAYLGDVTTPLKKQLKDYKMFEDMIMHEISHQFVFEYPFSEEVKQVDQKMLITEAIQFYGRENVESWELWVEPYNLSFTPVRPALAKQLFLNYYEEYKNQKAA